MVAGCSGAGDGVLIARTPLSSPVLVKHFYPLSGYVEWLLPVLS